MMITSNSLDIIYFIALFLLKGNNLPPILTSAKYRIAYWKILIYRGELERQESYCNRDKENLTENSY